MTDKEKIKQEFSSRLENAKKALEVCPSSAIAGMVQAYENVLSFIDSLPEEPVSEDLEEAANKVMPDGMFTLKSSISPEDDEDA